jgi:hypothetical protein
MEGGKGERKQKERKKEQRGRGKKGFLMNFMSLTDSSTQESNTL